MSVSAAASRATDAEFLETAAAVFAARGYEGSSFSEIASALGITRPTLYASASNKQDLFLLVIDGLMREYDELIAQQLREDDPPLRRLAALVHIQIEMLRRRPESLRLALQSIHNSRLPLPSRFRGWVRVMNRRILAIIEDGRARGHLRDDVSATVQSHLLRSLLNELPFWYRPGPSVDAATVAEAIVAFMAPDADTRVQAARSARLDVAERTPDRLVLRYRARGERDLRAETLAAVEAARSAAGIDEQRHALSLTFLACDGHGVLRTELERTAPGGSAWSVRVVEESHGRLLGVGHLLSLTSE